MLLRWFDAETWLELAAEQRSQTTAVVPSMLAMLLALPLEEYDLSDLRFVFSGGGSAPAGRARGVHAPGAGRDRGRGVRLHRDRPASSAAPRRCRPGRARWASRWPIVEVRIEAPDGSEVPRGEDGEIVVRGPNVMARLLGRRRSRRTSGSTPATSAASTPRAI